MLRILPLLLFAARAADNYFPPPDKDGGWRMTKSVKEARHQAGVDLSKLEPAFEITQRSTAHGGLLVVPGLKYAAVAQGTSFPWRWVEEGEELTAFTRRLVRRV